MIQKLSQNIKKLTKHDFIISGKRFQIKQPPVLTIKNQTKVTEIIVKVGVSQLNMKEFLRSMINENIIENTNFCELSDSAAGMSHLSKYKPANSMSSGLSSHYGLGLRQGRRAKDNMYEDIGSSPDAKMSRASLGGPISNFDGSSIGSSGSQQLKLTGLSGLKLQST